MHKLKTSSSILTLIFGALVLVMSFQNCAKAKFETDASSAVASKSASSAGDDASLSIPNPSAPGNDVSVANPTPTPAAAATPIAASTPRTSVTPSNSQTTTVITSGSTGTCPNAMNNTPNVSINVSTGNNTQSNNFGMKAAAEP